MIWFAISLLCVACFILALDIYQRKYKKIKKEAPIKKSVLRGQAYEKIFPAIQDNYCLGDLVFIGQPVDYIAFVGRSDILDGDSKEIQEIVFIEIKTGKSRLTQCQIAIKTAIEDGRISWRTITI